MGGFPVVLYIKGRWSRVQKCFYKVFIMCVAKKLFKNIYKVFFKIGCLKWGNMWLQNVWFDWFHELFKNIYKVHFKYDSYLVMIIM